MDRAQYENRSFLVPASFAQGSVRVRRRMRLEGPGSISAEFGLDAESCEKLLRLNVACDNQRIGGISFTHPLDDAVHVTGFTTIADGELVFGGGKAKRANHHSSEGVGKLAFEHRPFAGDHAMVLVDFAEEKWRINIGKIDLASALEVATGSLEILGHYAEVNVLGTEDVANLPQHLLHPDVAAGVACAVVAGE